jgi:hypothetical protein
MSLVEIMKSQVKSRVFICGEIDKEKSIIRLWKANGKKVLVPFSYFIEECEVKDIDFNNIILIIDKGTSIKIGEYEFESWSIILRHNCKKLAKKIIKNKNFDKKCLMDVIYKSTARW